MKAMKEKPLVALFVTSCFEKQFGYVLKDGILVKNKRMEKADAQIRS